MKGLKYIFKIGRYSLGFLAVFLFLAAPTYAQTQDLLTPQETLWLQQRNNTIVVYPEANNPPYSYQSPSGSIEGLSIDYLELIAQKVGAKIQYLTPRSHSQILSDVQAGKGDVIAAITPDTEKENYLLFTESYAVVPVVIVVRKDSPLKSGLTLNDFNGKQVAMIQGSSIENYVNINYPRVVREDVTDDEVGLQQVVLGEADAAVMDVASLSYYLSKQVLSSVRIVGDSGLDYKPAFAMTKDKAALQSILEKGLSQITINDRNILNDKWIALPGDTTTKTTPFLNIVGNNLIIATLYLLFGVGIIAILIMLMTRRHHRDRYFRKVHDISDLKSEFSDLQSESEVLTRELSEVRAEEDKLKEKITSLSQ